MKTTITITLALVALAAFLWPDRSDRPTGELRKAANQTRGALAEAQALWGQP